jgi:hypothetical protein
MASKKAPARKTRRRRSVLTAAARASTSTKVLEVRSPSQIQELEGLLAKGPMTLVLVFADWCPACHRFMKDLWKPMCAEKMPATMNRAAIREDLVPKTSLANSQYKYLPTLMLVGSDKRPASFESPEGATNAMPTPRTPDELKRVMTLSPSSSSSSSPSASMNTPVPQTNTNESTAPLEANVEDEKEKDTIPRQQGGCACMMRGGGAAQPVQSGGLYDVLMRVEQGTLPLSSLVPASASPPVLRSTGTGATQRKHRTTKRRRGSSRSSRRNP